MAVSSLRVKKDLGLGQRFLFSIRNSATAFLFGGLFIVPEIYNPLIKSDFWIQMNNWPILKKSIIHCLYYWLERSSWDIRIIKSLSSLFFAKSLSISAERFTFLIVFNKKMTVSSWDMVYGVIFFYLVSSASLYYLTCIFNCLLSYYLYL